MFFLRLGFIYSLLTSHGGGGEHGGRDVFAGLHRASLAIDRLHFANVTKHQPKDLRAHTACAVIYLSLAFVYPDSSSEMSVGI